MVEALRERSVLVFHLKGALLGKASGDGTQGISVKGTAMTE
jgi:hypothetical protein